MGQRTSLQSQGSREERSGTPAYSTSCSSNFQSSLEHSSTSDTLPGSTSRRLSSKPRASRKQSKSRRSNVTHCVDTPVESSPRCTLPLGRAPTLLEEDSTSLYSDIDHSYLTPDTTALPARTLRPILNESPTIDCNAHMPKNIFPYTTIPKVNQRRGPALIPKDRPGPTRRYAPEHTIRSFHTGQSRSRVLQEGHLPKMRLKTSSYLTPSTLSLPQSPLPRPPLLLPPRLPLDPPLSVPSKTEAPSPIKDNMQEATVDVSVPSDSAMLRLVKKNRAIRPVTMALLDIDKKFRVKLRLVVGE
nr:uncharacterized protein LOC123765071 isoform X2 [Procambarus clarkii]